MIYLCGREETSESIIWGKLRVIFTSILLWWKSFYGADFLEETKNLPDRKIILFYNKLNVYIGQQNNDYLLWYFTYLILENLFLWQQLNSILLVMLIQILGHKSHFTVKECIVFFSFFFLFFSRLQKTHMPNTVLNKTIVLCSY